MPPVVLILELLTVLVLAWWPADWLHVSWYVQGVNCQFLCIVAARVGVILVVVEGDCSVFRSWSFVAMVIRYCGKVIFFPRSLGWISFLNLRWSSSFKIPEVLFFLVACWEVYEQIFVGWLAFPAKKKPRKADDNQHKALRTMCQVFCLLTTFYYYNDFFLVKATF